MAVDEETQGHLPAALESRASFLLSQLGLQSAQSFAAGLTPLGLDPNRFGLLVHVARIEGQSQQRLAEVLGIHQNTMVGIIDDLEARGLVQRRRHPNDRRAYAIHLTPAARELLPAASRVADEQETRLLNKLSEAERAKLIELLSLLAQRSGYRAGVHGGLGSPHSGSNTREDS